MNKVLDKNELEKIIKLKMSNDDDYDGTSARYSPVDTITIPEGYEEIDGNAFEKVYNLRTVNLPSTLKTIRLYAFHDCRDLKRVNCFSEIVYAQKCAFLGCHKLQELNINIQYTHIQTLFNDSIPKRLRFYKLADCIQGEVYSQTYIAKNAIGKEKDYKCTANGTRKPFIITEPIKQ